MTTTPQNTEGGLSNSEIKQTAVRFADVISGAKGQASVKVVCTHTTSSEQETHGAWQSALPATNLSLFLLALAGELLRRENRGTAFLSLYF